MDSAIRDAVMSQVEEKIGAGETLAEAIRAEEAARTALAEATAEVARARQNATRSGWSESELKALGLIPTMRATKTRAPRKTSTADNH